MTERPGRPPCRSGPSRGCRIGRGLRIRNDTVARMLSGAGRCAFAWIARTFEHPHAANCRETARFSAFRRFSPPVRLPAPDASRMVLAVRARSVAGPRPSSRTTAVRAVPAAHRLRDAARRRRAFMRKEA
ncbi:transposase [Burkholderia cenocepacia H111]|nr:transposase [Burkholderia cenocepacia H111]